MTHHEALDKKAAERYLLGELSEPERFDFEHHYFGCQECAEDVRSGELFARGVKAVYQEEERLHPSRRGTASLPAREPAWRRWFTVPVLAPAFAALALACIVSYQAFVLVPSLRNAVATNAVTAVVLRAAARGDEAPAVERKGDLSVLSADVNGVEPGAALTYEVAPGNESAQLTGNAQAPPPGTPLLLIIRNRDLQTTGLWTLRLRDRAGMEVGRYSFRVK